MNLGKTVFSQLMEHIDHNDFHRIVRAHLHSRRRLPFSCWEQYLCMAFAQLTYRESLRDIESCLRSLGPKLYHAGMRSSVSRSTLAHANEHRPWQIYRDLALKLVAHARELYAEDRFLAEIDAAVYALDATVIDLCLKLFPWAKAQQHLATTAAVKLHTLLDVQRNLPVFARVSVANLNEVRMLDEISFEPGAFYVVDRGYTSFHRLKNIDAAGAFFVIRAKRGLRFKRIVSHPVDKPHGVLVDQVIRFVVRRSLEEYPDQLRRIKFFDAKTHRVFVFLTNDFLLEATAIAELYHSRWRIELFFKWMKQHLRIKAFYGTTFNAVNTQIWIALSVFVLVAILKKKLHLDLSLYTILQILSLTLFEKEPIYQVLTETQIANPNDCDPNQLTLFNL